MDWPLRPPRLGAVRLLAVDGPSGSGKSRLTSRIAAELTESGMRVEVVPTDRFATWDDPVSWWPRLVTGVLVPLRQGRPGRYRRTDWSTGVPMPGDLVDVPVPDVLVCEGVSAGRRSVRPLLSCLIWVQAPEELRLARAVERDGAHTLAEHRRWRLFETGWFAVDGTRAAADRVIE